MLSYKFISCTLSCINFVLLLIAQAFPGWAMILQDPLRPTYTGLWTICTEDECNFLSVREANLDFIRAFMLVALFSCFMAIICSTEWDYLINCSQDFFPEGPLAAIFNFITGINVLIAVIIFEYSASTMVEPEVEVLSNKWAFLLSCATCVLCFATGIFSLVLYKCSLWKAPLPFCQVFPGKPMEPKRS